MVVSLGMAGVDERHLIRVLCEAREDLARPRAALAVLRKLKWGFHQPANLIGKKARLVVKTFELLAVAPRQLRFVIPGIDLALSAIHEEPDDGLRLGRKVAEPRAERVGAQVVGGGFGGAQASGLFQQ